MKCLLVFNHLNDVVYIKYNKKFAIHINDFAKGENLLPADAVKTKLTVDLIVQIFSPIVTSQRIMSCQFGNSYTSIQCKNGMNMCFEDYMGYLFVCVSVEDVISMKRLLNVCVTMVRYLCGPNVKLLKTNTHLSAIVTGLLDSWNLLQNTEQAAYVEAIEQLMVNSDTSSAALKILKEAVDKLKSHSDYSKTHALILVNNKFLALYSSPNANELSPTDILFLTLLVRSSYKKEPQEAESDSDEEFYSPSSSPVNSGSIASINEIFQPDLADISCFQVLLNGTEYQPKCLPHAVHIKELNKGIHLVILIETHYQNICVSLYNCFAHLHHLQMVQIQEEAESLRPAFERLDAVLKKLVEGLKKVKNNGLESVYKQLQKKWDYMRKMYVEFIKSNSVEALLNAECRTSNLLETLCEVLSLTAFDQTLLKSSLGFVLGMANAVKEKLSNYDEFLLAKALRNFPLETYLEEFPGLVHFIYVDRTSHRITAPTFDMKPKENNILTKEKIWEMVHFSRNHLQEGHLSLMWKDTTFNYAYFLWFEDTTGAPLKPTVFPTNASKVLPQAGILCGDFYQKLRESCFPKMSPNKIRCYELFCVHLGLATASCVLEQTRRLAASVWELRGHPNHPIDLL